MDSFCYDEAFLDEDLMKNIGKSKLFLPSPQVVSGDPFEEERR